MSSDILAAAIALRDRLATDAALARDRAEYLRTVANWGDAARIVDGLVAVMDDKARTDRDRLDAATVAIDLHALASEGPACSSEGCA